MIQGRLVTNRQPGGARAANCNVKGITQAKCRCTTSGTNPFGPLESSYGKNLEKTHSETPRKLKSENNEKANKQDNNVVLQLPRRLIYKIRRIDSGAASHEQTAGRGARSQRGLNSNGVHRCARSMRHVAEQPTRTNARHDVWMHRKNKTNSKNSSPLALSKNDHWSR